MQKPKHQFRRHTQQRFDSNEDAANNVRVVLRIRPLLPSEAERGETSNAHALPDQRSVMVTAQLSQSRKVETQQHLLDRVFPPATSQLELFHQSGVESFCDAALEGMAATVFCFGQTGSGKTYTMSGPALDCDTGSLLDDHSGLQYRASYYMARAAQDANAAACSSSVPQQGGDEFKPVTLRASYIEIYNEMVNDLLNETTNLRLRWSQAAQSFFIESLMIVQCDDASDMMAVLAEGGSNRKRSTHKLNVDSSRSHVIYTIYVERREAPGAPPKLGKIHFVDLAGSEKLKDSESSGVNGEETRNINRSLFSLGNVISALSKGSTHAFVPYRDSTLTRLLMDSLGGNSKTLMVACITPSNRFTEESLRTIAYAMRTSSIVNAIPTVRLDAKQQQVYELKVELEMLRKENAALRSQLQDAGITPAVGGSVGSNNAPSRASSFHHERSSGGIGGMPSIHGDHAMGGIVGSPSSTNSFVLPSSLGSFMAPPGGRGVMFGAPPGTAQSSASAPAALYPTSPSGQLLPVNGSASACASPALLPAIHASSSWTTSSVRSLPPMSTASYQLNAGMTAVLSAQQQATADVAGRVLKDNEELRKEVALLRSMILEIRSPHDTTSPRSNAASVRQPPFARRKIGASDEPSSVSSSVERPSSPPRSPLPTSTARPSLPPSAQSGAQRQPSTSEHQEAAAPPSVPSSLTDFGFRPAPKKLSQKLVFPS